MYVIFNQDGSIKETQLGKYVNQHSKGVDFVDVAIDGRTNEDYACDANFALPNDTNVTEVAQINNKIVTSSGTYSGYRIGFNEAETEYDGDLSCSIRVYNKDGSVLWTFPFSIVVNKTTGYGDENITNDQYESLVRSMANYQLMFSKTNVRSYASMDEAKKDLASLAEGQMVFIEDGASQGAYIKKGDSFEMQSLDALSLEKYVKREVVDGTWELGSDSYTLSKTPTSYPFIAKFADSTNNATMEVFFCNGFLANGEQAYIGLLNDSMNMYAFIYYPTDTSQNIVVTHPYMRQPWENNYVLASKLSEENKCEWQSLKTVGGQSLLGTGNIDIGGMDFQSKTFLHSLTAKGATLSMSFTYPSTNELPVDSPQDATAVIKPTTDEYFASPVVVVATKKISDGYNCIHYNGTLWKFALWDGTSFTDGEAVTTWADSVVAVD